MSSETHEKLTSEQRLAEVRALGQQVAEFRARQSPDSPLSGAAFALAAMVGELDAVLAAKVSDEARK